MLESLNILEVKRPIKSPKLKLKIPKIGTNKLPVQVLVLGCEGTARTTKVGQIEEDMKKISKMARMYHGIDLAIKAKSLKCVTYPNHDLSEFVLTV